MRAQLPPLERDREREEVALAVLLGRTPKQRVRDPGQDPRSLRREARPAGRARGHALRAPAAPPRSGRGRAPARRRQRARREWRAPRCSRRSASPRSSAAKAPRSPTSSPAARPRPGSSPPRVTQPIFAGGRLPARTDAAEARERAALAQYQQAIRSAFGEVRTALIAQARARESYDAESARAAALDREPAPRAPALPERRRQPARRARRRARPAAGADRAHRGAARPPRGGRRSLQGARRLVRFALTAAGLAVELCRLNT